MKLVLYFCILILGQSAFAGASGGFDDDSTPAAKPVSKPAAAPAAPVKVTPAAKPNFPQCPTATSNANIGQDMMAKVLSIDEDFPIVVHEDKPCKGNSCTTITLANPAGKLNLSLSSPSISSASQICQNGNELQVSAQYMGMTYWLRMQKRDKNTFKLVMPSAYAEYSNTYSVGAK